MNALAARVAPQDVGSVFLYTHEAHPGEHYPHLTSLEQKFRHARALRDILGVTRPIVLDALDGACHRAYGSMPNMTWIFAKSGVPIYKSDWTDARSVANAIDYFTTTPSAAARASGRPRSASSGSTTATRIATLSTKASSARGRRRCASSARCSAERQPRGGDPHAGKDTADRGVRIQLVGAYRVPVKLGAGLGMVLSPAAIQS